jgi:hypothetical protein
MVFAMVNGRYRTEKAKVIEGPALVTYVCRISPIWGTFETGYGLQGEKVRVERGLFVPKGAKVVWGDGEALISCVVPAEEPAMR